MVGTIYRWLGVGTPSAEFVLSCISLAFIYISFLALDAAFETLGAAPIARLAALVLLALAPLNISMEMGLFRYWEGAIAAAGIALCLVRALELDALDGRPSWLQLGLLAGASGLMSLFSETAALACYGILGWLALRKRGWIGFVGAAAASAALLIAISYPWALRNEAVFGEKVWTRSNFGFNFALGYHDKAVSPSDPKKVFFDRLDEVSPFLHPAALASLKAAGGELGYNRLWIARTEEWIGQHPAGALKIAARHVWEFYFPPRWMWDTYAGESGSVQAGHDVDHRVRRVRQPGRQTRLQGLALYIRGRSIASTDAALRPRRADHSLPLPGWRAAGFPRCGHRLAYGAVRVETAPQAGVLARRSFSLTSYQMDS